MPNNICKCTITFSIELTSELTSKPWSLVLKHNNMLNPHLAKLIIFRQLQVATPKKIPSLKFSLGFNILTRRIVVLVSHLRAMQSNQKMLLSMMGKFCWCCYMWWDSTEGRAADSRTKGPGFKSSPQPIFHAMLQCVKCDRVSQPNRHTT